MGVLRIYESFPPKPQVKQVTLNAESVFELFANGRRPGAPAKLAVKHTSASRANSATEPCSACSSGRNMASIR